eukprot:5939280-Amphidinium_carterae.1
MGNCCSCYPCETPATVATEERAEFVRATVQHEHRHQAARGAQHQASCGTQHHQKEVRQHEHRHQAARGAQHQASCGTQHHQKEARQRKNARNENVIGVVKVLVQAAEHTVQQHHHHDSDHQAAWPDHPHDSDHQAAWHHDSDHDNDHQAAWHHDSDHQAAWHHDRSMRIQRLEAYSAMSCQSSPKVEIKCSGSQRPPPKQITGK